MVPIKIPQKSKEIIQEKQLTLIQEKQLTYVCSLFLRLPVIATLHTSSSLMREDFNLSVLFNDGSAFQDTPCFRTPILCSSKLTAFFPMHWKADLGPFDPTFIAVSIFNYNQKLIFNYNQKLKKFTFLAT